MAGVLAAARTLRLSASHLGLMGLALLAIVVLAINVDHARAFKAADVWRYYDILFDSDPNTRIWALTEAVPVADALHMHLPASVHPFLPYLASPFVMVGAELWALAVGAGAGAKPHMREMLALLVSPVCMSASIMLFGLALMWLGLPVLTCLAGAGLLAASYSSQIFGAIPEHYAFGALAIAALLAWLSYWVQTNRPISTRGYVAWIALAAYATGVTVTHVAVAGLVLLAADGARRGFAGALVRAALWSLAILIAVTIVGQAAIFLHETFRYSLGRHPLAAVSAFIALDIPSIASRLGMFAADTLQALFAVGVERVRPLHWWAQNDNDVIRPIPSGRWPAWAFVMLAIVAVLVVAGCVRGLLASRPVRIFTLVAAAILLFNIVMHAVFGVVMFLYSQHWLAAIAFFLVLNLPIQAASRAAIALRVAALAAVVMIAAWNIKAVDATVDMVQKITADHQAARARK